MVDINEDNIRKTIKEKGIEAIKADPKGFFKDLGVEITDRQAEGITKQIEFLSANMEEQIFNLFIIILK